MAGQSSSELSWKEELYNLLECPPIEKPGPKRVTWADVTVRKPIEPVPTPGRLKTCRKNAKINYDYRVEHYSEQYLRTKSRPLPSPWREEVRNRWKTHVDAKAAPERGMLSRLRDVPTKAYKSTLNAVLKLTENKWEELAETGTFLVEPVKPHEPGRVGWVDTPMIQRHYKNTVERNIQEIFQTTIKEADQLRETALIKPGNSLLKRCGIWLKDKVLGRPTPKKSCLKRPKPSTGDETAPSWKSTELRYVTSHQIQIPVRAELETEIRTVMFVSGCEIDLI
ncbi:hypothetical protein ROHU_032128 [Labeo rohita]|uniref:Uncharacterized protein n=1 Tax=Labeo rohita TaxID=84645 RepID=A0A498LM24_LABRO|nr:hypothetical protein ROHU_012910 [Labeo rohita]RXN07764.1 hypothetical protein ROHU_032128 [Labeo rohita]